MLKHFGADCPKCNGYGTVEQDEYGKITAAECTCQKPEIDNDASV